MKRLGVLMESKILEVAAAARLIHEIASVYPHKRRRFKKMCRTNPELMIRLGEAGFIEPWERWDDGIDSDEWDDPIVELPMVVADGVYEFDEPSLSGLDWYQEVVLRELATCPDGSP